MNLSKYNKLWVALAAALTVLGSSLADGGLTTAEIVGVVAAFVGAIGVYQVSNRG